ncbi:MAG TPA: hypothetical protein PKW08_07880 [Flavobacteriaceae bacterium]|nr:hypothetical protein [Flavobacteriaceae bacterium]MCB9213573.1 hypothetical protein [Alteromonas sp.]HPF12074.1 hypothetical protein [Flavobacteriaceae bacterium]HQU21495.1 hypothetical protein [Flavobacteriaceae bacterium]HQU65645.1 hypothetical protein [Flavobacteriaceae bacterium]
MKIKFPQNALLPAIFFMILLFSACEEIMVSPPAQTISKEEANRLEETYIQTRATILNDTLGYVDTREFWFSIDTLKKYIDYVEQEAAGLGKTNLGIRIYLGAYPTQGNYPDPGYSTVFLVPTYRDEGNPLKRGFLPMDEENQNIDTLAPLNYGQGGKPPHDY